MLKNKEAEAALQVLAGELGWDRMSTDDLRILATAVMCYFAQRLGERSG
jgi:hypothetical protein